MEKEVKIETIKIKMGEVEVSLTPDQAKELKDLLNDLFGNVTYTPYIPYIPYTNPYPPYKWIYWEPYYYDTPNTVTYCLNTNTSK